MTGLSHAEIVYFGPILKPETKSVLFKLVGHQIAHIGMSINLILSVMVLSSCALTAEKSDIQQVLIQNEQSLQRNADLLAKQSETITMMAAQQTELKAQLQQMQTQLDQKSNAKPIKKSTKPNRPVEAVASINSPSGLSNGANKLILGRYEWLWLDMTKQSVSAYLDTGRKTSMLAVTSMQKFERDGKDWVRFEWAGASEEAIETFEKPLKRTVNVRLANGESEKRPVVALKVSLGEITESTEFALTQTESDEPVVLGSTFLRDIAVVDVAKKYTQAKR